MKKLVDAIDWAALREGKAALLHVLDRLDGVDDDRLEMLLQQIDLIQDTAAETLGVVEVFGYDVDNV